MGNFLNPDNTGYIQIINSQIYVDKTQLIEFLNKRLSTEDKCIALSHARRFGKSHAAGMLEAYYSRGCDSLKLFEGTKIAQNPDFHKHLNRYNVIHIDVSSLWDSYKANIIEEIIANICEELKKEYKDAITYKASMALTLMQAYEQTNIPFVIIIDEWDCIIRNSDDKELVHRYLQFLHSLFKSKESKSFWALGYITGILPIKKIQDESALNNFEEFTMLNSYPITEYFGFTEDEVKELCKQRGMDYDSMKSWYDGYLIDGMHMSNPNSVVMAIKKRAYDSYWRNTSSFETVNNFITMNYEGLKDDVMVMLAGGMARVKTDTFKNDLTSINSKNNALTALIHLGYLAYDSDKQKAYIPNYEVSTAFEAAIEDGEGEWGKIGKTLSTSRELMDETVEGNAERVAELLELAHDTYASSLKYNDENSLSCVLTMAYFTAPAYYNVIREFPSGKGFADFAFIPRANAGSRPAMIIELKYDKSAETAIRQIKEKRYAGALKGHADKILLVGINYDSDGADKKKHTCIIEECFSCWIHIK